MINIKDIQNTIKAAKYIRTLLCGSYCKSFPDVSPKVLKTVEIGLIYLEALEEMAESINELLKAEQSINAKYEILNKKGGDND